MQFNTYTSAGAQVACWLANSLKPDDAALAAVLTRYEVHQPEPAVGDAQELHPWARRIRAVFETDAVVEKAQLVDSLLIAARCSPRLVSHGAGLPFHLHYASVRDDLTSRVKALTAAGLAHLIDDGLGDRLGACARAECSTAFVDVSRNGRRKFCSVRCANQVNVAAHRARHRRFPGPALASPPVAREPGQVTDSALNPA